ncbi:MAG: zinc-dependent alcohol dehydrogenase family protein [Spirochaetales bacterium]|nr:zinc-dependent alcohol dehydrogenase family protein [Spirochaetales bacterium]
MNAMVIQETGPITEQRDPVVETELPVPEPSNEQVRIKISACGVCHTELDEIEGRTPPPKLPVVPGHQVVGVVDKLGPNAGKYSVGARVGVGWIYSACGKCSYCKTGRENLCPEFKATGRDADGGYAEYMVVNENYAYYIPDVFSDIEAAPLLCAGGTGYRSLNLTDIKAGMNLGFTGFGASAHLVLQIALQLYQGLQCFVFARGKKQRDFALELGAVWAGDTNDKPPELLDAVIDTTPVWKPPVSVLKYLKPGGRLVINAIRKEQNDKNMLMNLDYSRDLWMEKEIKSVANVTAGDIDTFLKIASEIPVKPVVEVYKLSDAGKALRDLKAGNVRGAKVLVTA